MRRLPAILVTILLAVLLVAAVATATLMGGPAPTSGAEASAPQPTAPAEGAPAGGAPAPGAPAPGAPAPGAPVPGAPATAPTSVAFLGDGYTSGSDSGGRGPANYTAILAAKDGFTATTDAVYGTGYVVDPALETRVQKIVEAGPQLVVVSAGRADDQSQPAFVGAAATRTYEALKTKLPQAKIVVIGPIWLGSDVPERLTAINDAIRGSAEKAGLTYIDPIAERWFVGGDQDGIAANKLDLNDKGQQRLAQLVDEALKRSGALPN